MNKTLAIIKPFNLQKNVTTLYFTGACTYLLKLLFSISVMVSSAAGAATYSGNSSYLVGTSKLAVTPPTGTLLAGYGRNRTSIGSFDKLFTKAVYIQDQYSAIVIVTIDCIGLTRPDIELIQKKVSVEILKLKPEAVIISSTHTHAGPDVVGLWGESMWSNGRDEQYMSELRGKIIANIIAASNSTVVATSKVTSAQVIMDWVENRSEPGLLDPTMTVLQFVDESGITVATLTNFACHPTILNGDNRLVSADYVSGFYLAMEESLPGEHLFIQGAIGGWVQPLQGDHSIDLARKLGRELANESLSMITKAQKNPSEPLVLRHKVFDIKVENWGFRLMMWLGVLDRETFSGAMRTEAAWFKIGKVEFVTHPGETSPAFSLASRQLLNTEHSFVMGLTQDAIGYILKPEYFADDADYPHGDYLQSVSVGEQAGPILMSVLNELIAEKKISQ